MHPLVIDKQKNRPLLDESLDSETLDQYQSGEEGGVKTQARALPRAFW